MESIKNKIGILVLLLCIGIIIAAIGYCLFGASPNSGKMMEGTLVLAPSVREEMVIL